MSILIIATSHSAMGDTGRTTGIWCEELSTPYYVFKDGGLAVTVATLTGGPIPIDPNSMKGNDGKVASVERFGKDPQAMKQLEHTEKLEAISIEKYAAIFLPGGHGAMWDFPLSQLLADRLSEAWAKGKILSAVCHGPAGLVHVKERSGKPLVAGKRVTAFTNAEEASAGLTEVVPFLLETKLRELGADFVAGPDFQPHIEQDGRLITGQNPASSENIARLVLKVLS